MFRYLAALLVVVNACTALSLLWVSHEHRRVLMDWQAVEQRKQSLETRREQLLLEQAALGAHGRIETLAKQKLKMHYPTLIEQERLDCCE